MAKPIVLQLGGPIRYNHDQYSDFKKTFDVVVNDCLSRESFTSALRNKRFGDFYAIYRPFWNDGFQMGPWDKELIDLVPSSCKIIAMAGAGFDWMDIEHLNSKSILYCNGGWGPTEAVGDNAIWHILSTFRNFGWSMKSALTCDPDTFKKAHTDCVLTAWNPKGHTLGIIGMGKIGYRIAEKASKGLDMKIAYFDLFQRSPEQEKAINAKFYRNLEDMLPSCDCVVLATPAFKDKFINKDVFSNFKKGGRFVNIARGKLVDEQALLNALKSGQLYAAGLDVFYDEPQVPKALAEWKTVSLTCHNGGGSISTWVVFELLGMKNILGWYKNKTALSPVNLRQLNEAKL